MCIFSRKYSANESEEKLAAAIAYVIANDQMKNYKNLMNFCSGYSVTEGINPKSIKFKRFIITDNIVRIVKLWKHQQYKCSNKYLTKGIERLQSQI